jgi:hypothetical protein
MRFCPRYPDRFPSRMLAYDRYAGEQDWHPREVDELELDELFWLPVIREAKMTAVQQVSAAKEGPLQY